MKENKTRQRYDRIAWMYDFMELPAEVMSFSRWRRGILSSVSGRVLEVGIGTGKNLLYYPRGIKLVGIDISPKMIKRAEKRAATVGHAADLLIMDAEDMSFPAGSFDFVVSTFVFCSVPHPVKGLREIKRVLRFDGVALFLEHVRSTNTILGTIMDVLNPLVRSVLGPNINRRTVDNIREAGLKITSVENKGTELVKQITARVV